MIRADHRFSSNMSDQTDETPILGTASESKRSMNQGLAIFSGGAPVMKRMAIVVMVTCLCLSWVSTSPGRDTRFENSPVSQQGDPVFAPLFNNDADTNIRIKITLDKPLYHAGEPITFTVVSDRDCYLTLMYLSASGRVVIIWPYQTESLERKVLRNQTIRVPDTSGRFKFVSDGSAPYERIFAFACAEKNCTLVATGFPNLSYNSRSVFAKPVRGFRCQSA